MELPARMGCSMPSASRSPTSSSTRSGSRPSTGETDEWPWFTLSYAKTSKSAQKASTCWYHASAHPPKPWMNTSGAPCPVRV